MLPDSHTHQHVLSISVDVLESKPSLMNNKHSDSKGSAFWGIPGPSLYTAGARDRDDSTPETKRRRKELCDYTLCAAAACLPETSSPVMMLIIYNRNHVQGSRQIISAFRDHEPSYF